VSDERASVRSEAVHFVDVQPSLTLFAQALAARPFYLSQIEQTPRAPDQPLPSDGRTLFLPAHIASFASRRNNRGAYRVAVLRQLGYLTEGTLDFDLTKARMAPATYPARPSSLARETVRFAHAPSVHARRAETFRTGASDLQRFFASVRQPKLLCQLFLLLEGLRIDTALRRRYPGARADLDRALALELGTRPVLTSLGEDARLIEALAQYSLGAARQHLVERDESGLLEGLLALARRLEGEQANVYDSTDAALHIYRLLTARRASGLSSRREDEAERDSLGGSTQDDAAELDASGAFDPLPDEVDSSDAQAVSFRPLTRADLLGRQLGAGAIGSVDPQTSAQTSLDAHAQDPSHADRTIESGQHPALAPRARSSSARDLEQLCFWYDEWNFRESRYLSAWCCVREVTLRGEDRQFLLDVRRRHAAIAREIKLGFRLLRPEQRQRVHRRSDGDELDLDGLIDAVIDRKSGHAIDARLYLGHERALRDVCATFLVDMSASTDFPVPDAQRDPTAQEPSEADDNRQSDEPVYLYSGHEPGVAASPLPTRRVIDVAKDSLVLMCDALHGLGDQHAIYGFTSAGREQVELFVVKAFEEPWSARAAAAIAAMEPKRATRTGAAVRHAVSKLKQQPARVRVLVIITDGYPEDLDYGSRPNDLEHGLHDTARALREAEAEGISTFCIAIDRAGHDYLRRMCDDDRYLVIDDITSLPRELTKVYSALTSR
jgi:nitric oxide reductase NorD protein